MWLNKSPAVGSIAGHRVYPVPPTPAARGWSGLTVHLHAKYSTPFGESGVDRGLMPLIMNFCEFGGTGMTIADALEKATETFLIKSAAARRGLPFGTYSVNRDW